jgi:hypothetical protein
MASLKHRARVVGFIATSGLVAGLIASVAPASATTHYDINTLAGKLASLQGTAGLQIRFSAFLQEEAQDQSATQTPASPITPSFVLSSPLDGSTVAAPDVTVNQDTAAAPQNETAIAVDPNNPNRVVAAANDYVSRAWPCTVGSTPCSALGDGYSGTYFSNNGGATWAGLSSDPSHLGTLIPGVERLTGGQYDAGGDPSVAFDSKGNVYYAGLGFNRTSAPNTVAVNKGTFDSSGNLTWGPPTFIDQTTSPAVLNDKEWIAADSNPSSPFRDRVYVTYTRFVFNAHTGSFVQAPIQFAYSNDGGATFSTPVSIGGNVLYDQGSRPIVGPDGTLYVIFEGATRLAALDSEWIVKSTDGGVTFSKPVKIADVQDIIPPANTAFRVNSFPAGAAAPNGDLYVAWSSQQSNSGGLCPTATNSGCHVTAMFSKSTDGGATWSAASPIFPGVDASSRTVRSPRQARACRPGERPERSAWSRPAASPGSQSPSGWRRRRWGRSATPPTRSRRRQWTC